MSRIALVFAFNYALLIANYELICGRKNVRHKMYEYCFDVVEKCQKNGKYFYGLHKKFSIKNLTNGELNIIINLKVEQKSAI